MELFAIGVCALCAALFAALVQKTNKEYALLISLGTAAVLLLFLLERAGPVLQQVEDLAASGPLEGEAVGLMLRAVGTSPWWGRWWPACARTRGNPPWPTPWSWPPGPRCWQRPCPPWGSS